MTRISPDVNIKGSSGEYVETSCSKFALLPVEYNGHSVYVVSRGPGNIMMIERSFCIVSLALPLIGGRAVIDVRLNLRTTLVSSAVGRWRTLINYR